MAPAVRMITAQVRDGALRTDSAEAVPWWSFGKTVLASAALALVAQGRLSLDGPIEGKPFTLRQVLQHRAGLTDYGASRAYHDAVAAGGPVWPASAMLDRVGADRLIYPPGEGWAYSNIGYWMVRGLVERAADARLGAALKSLVFRPLGIVGVSVAETCADLQATAWGNDRGYDPGWVYHGLLVGPAGSAALLLDRLLVGGLLPMPLLDAMRATHPVPRPLLRRPWLCGRYGLGLMAGKAVGSRYYVGHTGGGPGSSGAAYRFEAAAATTAAFAPLDDPVTVEETAMSLASGDRWRAGT